MPKRKWTAPLPLEDKEHQTSWRSQRGLDWFAFFLADIQTGWGPFVAAYLTSKSWTQLDIGLILTVGTVAAMALQIPIGALVDYIPGGPRLSPAEISIRKHPSGLSRISRNLINPPLNAPTQSGKIRKDQERIRATRRFGRRVPA
jgi:hypothetical protein